MELDLVFFLIQAMLFWRDLVAVIKALVVILQALDHVGNVESHVGIVSEFHLSFLSCRVSLDLSHSNCLFHCSRSARHSQPCSLLDSLG